MATGRTAAFVEERIANEQGYSTFTASFLNDSATRELPGKLWCCRSGLLCVKLDSGRKLILDVMETMYERVTDDRVILTSNSRSLSLVFPRRDADRFVFELDACAGRRAPTPAWMRDELELDECLIPAALMTSVADVIFGLQQTGAYKSGKAEAVMKAILSVAFGRPGLAAELAEVTQVVLDDLPGVRAFLPREGECVGHRRLLGALGGEWEGDEDPLLVHLRADDVNAFSMLIHSSASPDFNKSHRVERVKQDFLTTVKDWARHEASLLEIAARFGASKCARFLLANDADVRLEEAEAAIFGGSRELIRMMLDRLGSEAVEANCVRLMWAALSGRIAEATRWLLERHAGSLTELNERRLFAVACHGDFLAGALALLEFASPALRRLPGTSRIGRAALRGEIVADRDWVDGASGYGEAALMTLPRQGAWEALRGRDEAGMRALGGAIPIGPRAAADFSMPGLELADLRECGWRQSPSDIFSGVPLKSVLLPEGLEEIGGRGFERCNLIELVLPDSVRVIGPRAFLGCGRLRRVTFGRGLEIIGDESFVRCESLLSLEFPERLQRIGDYAFCLCLRLSSAAFPASLDFIGEGAFYETRLGSIALPPAISELGNGAFGNCRNLTAVTLGDIKRWSGDSPFAKININGWWFWYWPRRTAEPDSQPANRIALLRLIGENWDDLQPSRLAPFLSSKAMVMSARFAGRRVCGITVTAE
jgi:hypothetical protein